MDRKLSWFLVMVMLVPTLGLCKTLEVKSDVKGTKEYFNEKVAEESDKGYPTDSKGPMQFLSRNKTFTLDLKGMEQRNISHNFTIDSRGKESNNFSIPKELLARFAEAGMKMDTTDSKGTTMDPTNPFPTAPKMDARQSYGSCSGIAELDGPSGYIWVSESGYQNNLDCEWQISVPSGQIRITWRTFSLESNPSCAYDYVQLLDNPTDSTEPNKYCGTQLPPTFTSSNNRVVLRFHSDFSVTSEGFFLTYTTVRTNVLDASSPSGSIIVTPEDYQNNLDTEWHILAPPAYAVRITWLSFNLESHSSCYYDFVQLLNGPWDSTEQNKYCGTQLPPAFTSSSNQLVVRFHTDYSVTAGGFSLTYTAVPGTPTGPTGGDTGDCGVANRAMRIVGGQETEVNEYPWQVGLSSKSSISPFCGGSVYSSKYVITAAHCVNGVSPSAIEVLLATHNWVSGNGGAIELDVEAIIVHEGYNPSSSIDNDIALVRVAGQMDLSLTGIAPICLPDPNTDYTSSDATVSGWGTTSEGGSQSSVLMDVVVPIRTRSECENSYPGSITDNMLCAGYPEGGKDSCQGDSGGPLTVEESGRYSLVGIVSWGFGCAREDYFGVYTKVQNYVDWIAENAQPDMAGK